MCSTSDYIMPYLECMCQYRHGNACQLHTSKTEEKIMYFCLLLVPVDYRNEEYNSAGGKITKVRRGHMDVSNSCGMVNLRSHWGSQGLSQFSTNHVQLNCN